MARLDSSAAAVAINVNHVNHSPIAIGQNLTLTRTPPHGISLTGTDADGDILTFAIVTQPQHGTLSGSGPSLVYTSVLDYFGPDFFTFRVNDGIADSESAGCQRDRHIGQRSSHCRYFLTGGRCSV